MGIPYYVASLLKAHQRIQQKCLPGVPLEKVDCLGIDFNCFIHSYLKSENPAGSITVAFDELITGRIVHAKRALM
jgi:hypothetical protein